MEKIEIARRQLGMAMHLYLEDLDPVSVHSLAGNAHEVLHRLADKEGKPTFRDHVLQTFPGFTPKRYFDAANLYRNAFKHLNKDDDQDLINDFSDEQNTHLLFVCWHTYMNLTAALPIEAQCFQFWYFSFEGDRSSDPAFAESAKEFFGELINLSTSERKQRLRAAIAVARSNVAVMSDPKTEKIPLAYTA